MVGTWLTLGFFVVAFVVACVVDRWIARRQKRYEDVPVVGGYEAIETLKRAGKLR